jgi:hypothetical protein
MQSNTSTEHLRVVTEQDVLGAMVTLGSLPKRQSDQAQLDLEAYKVALDRTLAIDLAAAVRSILQGALGHAFFPSPPEFRIQCNANADNRAAVAERERKAIREREDRMNFREVSNTPEQRARVAEAYQRFLDSRSTQSEVDELAAIRAKYDPEKLAKIPDRDADATWRRVRGIVAVKAMAA